MFRILWAHCKCNLWKNIVAGMMPFVIVFIVDVNLFIDEKNIIQNIILACFVVLLTFWSAIDIRLPKTLYICPYSYEDRKNYIRKIFLLKNIVFPIIYFLCTFTLFFIGKLNWYTLIVQNLLFFMIVWIANIGTIIRYDDKAETRMDKQAQVIGWGDAMRIVGGIVMGLLGIFAMRQSKPALDMVCVFHGTLIIVGYWFAIGIHKKHYQHLVSMAANFEAEYDYEKDK